MLSESPKDTIPRGSRQSTCACTVSKGTDSGSRKHLGDFFHPGDLAHYRAQSRQRVVDDCESHHTTVLESLR